MKSIGGLVFQCSLALNERERTVWCDMAWRLPSRRGARSPDKATTGHTRESLTLYISRLVGITDGSVAHFGEQTHPLLIRLRHLEMVTKATRHPIYRHDSGPMQTVQPRQLVGY